jgi:hypothetical protein
MCRFLVSNQQVADTSRIAHQKPQANRNKQADQCDVRAAAAPMASMSAMVPNSAVL